ncbi:MAG: hypothetical protein IRY95_04395, partial [Clostridia bacterium]|nr:hypothetical protein [Clostridia bacterium]
PTPPGSARPRARAKADWYAAELWTPTAEAAEGRPAEAAATGGRLLLAVAGARSEAELPPLPQVRTVVEAAAAPAETVALSGRGAARLAPLNGGFALTWNEGASVYRVWAADREGVLAAAASMTPAVLLEGR